MKALIYTKNACPFCIAAKQLLENKNIPYEEINLEKDPTQKQLLQEMVPGAKTVPQIFIDNIYVGGFDQLKERFTTEGTAQLLID